jgi:hypothetical protein
VETPPAPVETPPAPVETPPAPVETPPAPVETHPAVISGPSTTPSRTATFVLAPGTWECQVPGTGQTSNPSACQGTYVVQVPNDGSYTLKVKDLSTGQFQPNWDWTVDSTLVSGRALGDLMLLDDPSFTEEPELVEARPAPASPFSSSADPVLTLMALLMALGLPAAHLSRWVRARRS